MNALVRHGRGVSALAGLALALAGTALSGPVGADEDRLREGVAGGQVDWREGRVSAGAGSAPDHRLPSPEVARAGAVQRARARAGEQLREALAHLPAAQKLSDESRARAVAAAEEKVEYQSDGGAWVRLQVAFGPWLDGAHKTSPSGDKASGNPWRDPLVLSVSSMRPVAGPVAEDKSKKVLLWRSRYREGVPPANQQSRSIEVEATASGSLRLASKATPWPDDLAQRDVLIYVKKLTR
jgi:hypothetical protein